MGRIMDAIHYDKIADKLIQFNSKLPQEVDLEFKDAIYKVKEMKNMIEQMLLAIDSMADEDSKGWIR